MTPGAKAKPVTVQQPWCCVSHVDGQPRPEWFFREMGDAERFSRSFDGFCRPLVASVSARNHGDRIVVTITEQETTDEG